PSRRGARGPARSRADRAPGAPRDDASRRGAARRQLGRPSLDTRRVPGDRGTPPGAGGGLMICYVELEHPELGPSLLSGGWEATEGKARLLPAKARFERLSGSLCLLFPFTQVDRRLLERLGVRAIIVSGHSTLIDDYDPDSLAPLVDIIRETRTPLLG